MTRGVSLDDRVAPVFVLCYLFTLAQELNTLKMEIEELENEQKGGNEKVEKATAAIAASEKMLNDLLEILVSEKVSFFFQSCAMLCSCDVKSSLPLYLQNPVAKFTVY